MSTIKVLAIDGGGIRGIVPAVILAELERRLKRTLASVFDLISGTSIGGIIALGVGTTCNQGRPYPPGELEKMLVETGPAIFKRSAASRVTQYFRPKYSPRALEETLARYFEGTQLKTALTPLLISSYDLEHQLPFFFKSHKIATDPSYNWPVTSVALATSAAPTYFPPVRLTGPDARYTLVDGGVFVNNPAMASYAEARAVYANFANFVVISVGTGDRQDRITYSSAKKWGLIGWAKQIVPVLMDSTSEAVDYELEYMPRCAYHRLQVLNLPAPAADMDNASPENIRNLKGIAQKFVASESGNLDDICALLEEGRGSDMPGIGYPSRVASWHPPRNAI
jgi:patatin-like phospholipase/acyl hydrolase